MLFAFRLAALQPARRARYYSDLDSRPTYRSPRIRTLQNIILLRGLVNSKNSVSFTSQNNELMRKFFPAVLLSLSFYSTPLLAQSADFMRSIGKMYVVVAVIVAIFIGLIVFLIYLDRRLTKLENQIKDHDAS